MANYATLKAAIQDVIKTNGTNDITGVLLQQSLLSMINSLGADYQFCGVATPDMNPGTPDQNVAYIAGPGTYANFGAAVIENGYLGVLKFNGSWSSASIPVGKDYSALEDAVFGINLEKTYPGRLESTAARISNVSGYVYRVVPVPGNVTVRFSAASNGGVFFYIVKSFTFNPTLPYDLVLATGETGRHIAAIANNIYTLTTPSDAKYLIMRDTPSLLEIDGRDVLKSLSKISAETNERVDGLQQDVSELDVFVNQKFNGAIVNQFVGKLESSAAAITQNQTAKYLVVAVKGGETVIYQRETAAAGYFWVCKDFQFNPSLPYNMVLATGESAAHYIATANYQYSYTLPSDAKYIILLSNIGGTDYIPETFLVDGENVMAGFNAQSDLIEEITDALVLRSQEGYYRAVSPYGFSVINGWYGTEPIPVFVGDKIITNSTYNTPYETVGHLCFDENGDFVQVLPMAAGMAEITQQMWDAGVRSVGISYLKSAGTPTLIIERNTVKAVASQTSDNTAKIAENAADIAALEQKEHIVIVPGNQYYFNVHVYNKTGKKTIYHFTRYLKVWDSLTYEDAQGQTQTKTNFTSTNMWGNDAINNDADVYIIQGNTNFTCQVYGDTRHIGDQHGNEVLKYVQFFADGVEFDPLSMSGNLECHEFRWVWKSDVYSPNLSGTNVYTGAYPRFDTSGNPIVNYEHYMDGVITDQNIVKLDNRLTMKRDGIVFGGAFPAMLECDFGKFTHVAIANADNTINAISSTGVATPVASDVTLSNTPNQYGNKAVMYGAGFVVEQSINVVSGNGTPNIHCEFYTNRLKNYFMPVKCQTYKAGSYDADTFNTGDVIRVLTYRKIDIK